MNRRHALCGLCALPAQALALEQAAPAIPAGTLRIACIQKDIEAWVARQMLAAIYAQAGLVLLPEMMPPMRASVALVAGDVDGELMRPLSYEAEHPELVRVPTPFYRVSVQAYSLLARKVRIELPDDLKRYDVGSVHGLAVVRELLAKWRPRQNASAVNHEQLCRMLKAGRVDAAVDTRLRMLNMLNFLQIKDTVASPELARFDLFHFLHRRNAEHAARLDETIRRMSNNGELERLFNLNLRLSMKMTPAQFD